MDSESAIMKKVVEKDPERLILVQKVDKSYLLGKRKLEVLREIDLEVEKGEFVAICGASGAGKSTLLHLLGGLDQPDKGHIQFEHHIINELSNAQLAGFRNLKIGFVFQSYHLLPELDALENVMIPARLARTPFHSSREKAVQLLETVGLAGRIDHRPSELSGGEQQRVAIARALINDPTCLLADEPTGNLDSQTGIEIIELLKSIQSRNQTTLIIASHDHNVASHAARILELVDGRMCS